ncbi:MAG: BLUF domain-containing protein [Pseudomonadota bacterium]
MRQLMYVSSTPRDIAPASLNEILDASRANNALLGVTGLLIYIDGGFLQILEGDERTVRELYMRICTDRRHWEVRMLLDREVEDRAFTGWSMGFERPSLDDPESAGMFGVTREAILGRLSPQAGRVIAVMLETFYRVQRSDDLRLADAKAS